MNYDPFFVKFVKGFIFEWECEYENGKVVTEKDPNDPGNWRGQELVGTKYGIDARSHPNVIIDDLTEESALAVYWEDFQKAGSAALPNGIREAHFDAAVNCGPKPSTLFLQRAINSITEDSLVEDGDLGPKTIKASVSLDSRKLVELMLERRILYYKNLAKKVKFARYLKGWLNRVESLRNALKSLLTAPNGV